MLYEITSAVAHANHTVTIAWSDGVHSTVNMTPFIAKGGLFSALQDPVYFVENMHLLPGGIGISWPNEIDFSADGLRYDSFPKEELKEFEEPIPVSKEDKSSPSHHEVTR
jgi:hypothetical protein